MIVNTKRFGQVQVAEDQLVTFIKPILGFEDFKSYFIMNSEGNEGSFEFLQSVEDENLTFIVMDPFAFFSDYEFQLKSDWIDTLHLEGDQDVRVLVIVTVRSESEITCNLKAPIIINKKNRFAAQIVLEQGKYATRQPLIALEKGAGSNADSIQK